MRIRTNTFICSVVLAAQAGAVRANEATPVQIQALRDQVTALKQEQENAVAQIRARTDEKIAAIEAALAKLSPAGASQTPSPAPALQAAAPQPNGGTQLPAGLKFSGDFRLRFESTTGASNTPDRERGVMRARLGAKYDITDALTLGARVATGDPDDPNSTDVTLSDFADDLTISLDQAYLRYHRGRAELYGGKIPNPFTRTELVWDGDVNPQGASASWSVPVGAAVARVTSIYSIVDEQAAGPDSDLRGVQLGLAVPSGRWSFDVAGAYYDYDLDSLAGAGTGDTRSNLLTPDGAHYLSDFNLIDVVGSATLQSADPRWPLKLVANYVRNSGAATSADTGYGVDFLLGRSSSVRDLRLGYGYSVAETDAVFAAFSHDNTTLATNYQQHTLALDYMLTPNSALNGTWYHYRLNDAPDGATDEWLDRIRLNVLVQF
jgi:hypothetical protein